MEITKIMVAAFAGAFFAYLFSRMADFFSAIYKRKKENYNELVYLERLLNLHLTTTHDNYFIAKQLSETLRSGQLEICLLNTYEVRVESLMKLTDINYLNKLFSFIISLRKINHDIELIQAWNTELRMALIQKHIDFNKYKEQAKILANNIDLIVNFFGHFEEQIIELLAENAVHLDKSKTIFIMIVGNKSKNIKREEINKKKEILLEELKRSKSESAKEMKQYTENTIFDLSNNQEVNKKL